MGADDAARVRSVGGTARFAVRRVAGDRGAQDRGDRRQRSASSRFDLKYSAGELPHSAMLRSIELYGTEVIPRVRELLAEGPKDSRQLALAGA